MKLSVGVLVVLILLAIFVVGSARPGPGRTLTFHSERSAVGTSTALLTKRGPCLSISRSEVDIGAKTIEREASSRLFQVALGPRLTATTTTDGGMQIMDESSGLTVTTGGAFDGAMTFSPKSRVGFLEQLRFYRWAFDDACGAGIAVLSSIVRVHP